MPSPRNEVLEKFLQLDKVLCEFTTNHRAGQKEALAGTGQAISHLWRQCNALLPAKTSSHTKTMLVEMSTGITHLRESTNPALIPKTRETLSSLAAELGFSSSFKERK